MTIAAERLSGTSVQQNDDMRRITAWVAIVAVPTAVTGFFGQNVPYPGFGENSGFIASIAIMLIILAMAWKKRFSPAYYGPVEVSGLYWHFVDIVWIFLFPLLYLIGRHVHHG